MKSYKVISLSVGGLGNKVYKSGDTVTEANFPAGNCADLVTKKYLEEIPEQKPTTLKKTGKKPQTIDPKTVSVGFTPPEGDGNPETGDGAPKDGDSNPGDGAPKDAEVNSGDQAKAKSFIDASGSLKEVLVIDDITKNQLIAELTAAQVEFDSNANKGVLFDLWMSL